IPNSSPEYADVDTVDVSGFPEESSVPVEVSRGTVVFFNDYTLHSSLRNKTSDHFRMALVNHYMSAESMLPWDQDGNWPPTADLRDVVLVLVVDPDVYKGFQDLYRPFLLREILDIRK